MQGEIDKELIERLTNVTLTLEPHDGAGYHLNLVIPMRATIAGTSSVTASLTTIRLAKEIEQLEKVIANSQRQLANEAFVAKAPAHVIDGMRAKLAEYEAQIAKNRAALGE